MFGALWTEENQSQDISYSYCFVKKELLDVLYRRGIFHALIFPTKLHASLYFSEHHQ